MGQVDGVIMGCCGGEVWGRASGSRFGIGWDVCGAEVFCMVGE